ncbi:branched-chain amino acid aminotransferase [Sneathiella sp. P13V-1]|uniref:branched-chain amino acid aminotransferase n=1 Tax=Sneathiella sp. P13V-1 TaxID=2697366 RepID=UPI00187B9430|nr:branched-chain amino acid aminotransferase [Sneathiella sp. P13V-1]MBE7638062.1 branched-chain amino acid aminotransferase [Sneathiella sp. P13V-1]
MDTTSFADRDGYIWFNGKLVDWRDANVHVLTHGLHYASSVFEGVRVYDGEIFKLTEHSERLVRSAEILGFDIGMTVEEINKACIETVAANQIVNGYLRPVAWRGSEMMGVSAQQNKINFAVAAWVWPSYFDPEARMKGIHLQLSKWKRPSPETIPTESKAAGLYMICTLSKHAAEREGYDDAVMLDYRGLVAEATGANIFFAKGTTLYTPTPDCFLDGITRRTVIDLAKARGYEVVERAIKPEEMADFDECFLTGTAAEVTPVQCIDDYTFTPGAVCQTLIADYENIVHRRAAA